MSQWEGGRCVVGFVVRVVTTRTGKQLREHRCVSPMRSWIARREGTFDSSGSYGCVFLSKER